MHKITILSAAGMLLLSLAGCVSAERKAEYLAWQRSEDGVRTVLLDEFESKYKQGWRERAETKRKEKAAREAKEEADRKERMRIESERKAKEVAAAAEQARLEAAERAEKVRREKLEKSWNMEAYQSYLMLLKNPRLTLTWSKWRLPISGKEAKEGEALLKEFAAKYMPNNYGRYLELKSKTKSIQDKFCENFPSPEKITKDHAERSSYEKVLKRLCIARNSSFRLHDELCHYYLLYKTGVVSSNDLVGVDKDSIAVKLPRIKHADDSFVPTQVFSFVKEHLAFACDSLPLTYAQYKQIEKEKNGTLGLLEDIRHDIRVMDIARNEQCRYACEKKVEQLIAQMNSTAKEIQKLYRDNRLGDVTTEGLGTRDRKCSSKLQEFVATFPTMVVKGLELQPSISIAGIDMVRIPGRNILMGRTEVTQQQWERVIVRKDLGEQPWKWRKENPSRHKGLDRPVENVTLMDCKEFIERLNENPEVRKEKYKFRLPTKDEWEYACLAGSEGNWGLVWDGLEGVWDDTCWNSKNSNEETASVAQKEPNAWGLYDMHGNVWEWTSTVYPDTINGYIRKGGSYMEHPYDCMAKREMGDRCNAPDYQAKDLGFRLVAEKE